MLRNLIKAILPYGLIDARNRLRLRHEKIQANNARHILHKARAEAILSVESVDSGHQSDDEVTYEALIDFLSNEGIDQKHLQEGSVPKKSLESLANYLRKSYDGTKPIFGLHIGNFVGVSLAYLAATVRQINSESVIIAVDPNIPHRGISNPQNHVVRLLTRFKLQTNVIVVAGYSQKKSISNDGVVFDTYDPVTRFADESSCEGVLPNLARLAGSNFDFAIIDGNHHADYLRQEIATCSRLLRPGGLLVLDDVDQYWAEIKGVFATLNKDNFVEVFVDGRIGVAQFIPDNAAHTF